MNEVSAFLAERVLRQCPKENRNDECGKWQSWERERDLNSTELLTKARFITSERPKQETNHRETWGHPWLSSG